MQYICHFPECEYNTIHKSKIDHHHVVPREVAKTKRTIPMCKNHHALIFHPEATAGQHSINTPESIVILEVYDSTQGKTMHYHDFNGKKFYYFFESRDVVED